MPDAQSLWMMAREFVPEPPTQILDRLVAHDRRVADHHRELQRDIAGRVRGGHEVDAWRSASVSHNRGSGEASSVSPIFLAASAACRAVARPPPRRLTSPR